MCLKNCVRTSALMPEVAVKGALCGAQGGRVPRAPLPSPVCWYGPQGARGSRAPGLGRAGARVGVQLRLRAGLCGRAVGIAATLGAAGRVTRGRAPPRRRDHVGAGARSSRGAVPRGQVLRGGRHRPAGTARVGPLRRAIFPRFTARAPCRTPGRSRGARRAAKGRGKGLASTDPAWPPVEHFAGPC